MLVPLLLISSTSVAQQPDYTFKNGDYIDLYVYNAPELTNEFRIQSDGYVRLPLIGNVAAAGKTESELYNSIYEALSVPIKQPLMTLLPKFQVSVLGYVERPGVFTISGTERIVEIIAEAGGFSPEASGRIEIYRGDEKIKIKQHNILESRSPIALIEPGDVIVAKRKLFTRSDYSVILSTLTTIALFTYYTTRD